MVIGRDEVSPAPAFIMSRSPEGGPAPTLSPSSLRFDHRARVQEHSITATAGDMVLDDTLVVHPLFGGAMEMALPNRLMDISDFKPVPDHQEVFADGSLDQSLIVEILEHQPVADPDSAAHFFNDLAEANEAPHSQIDERWRLGPDDVPGVPAECPKSIVVGQQAVTKGRQGTQALNKIQVILCNIRIPQYGTDLVITLNTPIFISEQSAAAEHAGAGFKGAHLTAPHLFRQMLSTLKIHDWSLFGTPAAQR